MEQPVMLLIILYFFSGEKQNIICSQEKDNHLSKGLHFMKASRPLWLRHKALRMFGSEAITSLVGGT